MSIGAETIGRSLFQLNSCTRSWLRGWVISQSQSLCSIHGHPWEVETVSKSMCCCPSFRLCALLSSSFSHSPFPTCPYAHICTLVFTRSPWPHDLFTLFFSPFFHLFQNHHPMSPISSDHRHNQVSGLGNHPTKLATSWVLHMCSHFPLGCRLVLIIFWTHSWANCGLALSQPYIQIWDKQSGHCWIDIIDMLPYLCGPIRRPQLALDEIHGHSSSPIVHRK
jgi:hypothetical protein